MRIKIDEDAFKATGLGFTRDSATLGTFTFSDITGHGEPAKVGVAIEDDELVFFPRRSSWQKRVLIALNALADTE